MASDNSFDIVSKIDMAEVKNAVNQATMEIKQRYDFKGSKSSITMDEKKNTVTLLSEGNVKLKSVVDIIQSKFIKRKIALKNMVYGNIEGAAEGMARQTITLQQGIPTDKAKEIIKIIKNTKLKVQSSIQQDQVRVTGKKRDDLQTVIQLLTDKDLSIDLQFINFR